MYGVDYYVENCKAIYYSLNILKGMMMFYCLSNINFDVLGEVPQLSEFFLCNKIQLKQVFIYRVRGSFLESPGNLPGGR